MTETAENTHELSVSRYIAAPPAKVWHAMTERLTEWWCPKPWRTDIEEEEIDWRAGSRFSGVMRGPEGEESPMDGVFLEVTPGKRFVFTDAFRHGWEPQNPFMVGIFEITPDGTGTEYRASARHWTTEAMEQHRQMGFEQGWGAVAEQLEALAEESA